MLHPIACQREQQERAVKWDSHTGRARKLSLSPHGTLRWTCASIIFHHFCSIFLCLFEGELRLMPVPAA
jgi:hypothetical protein